MGLFGSDEGAEESDDADDGDDASLDAVADRADGRSIEELAENAVSDTVNADRLARKNPQTMDSVVEDGFLKDSPLIDYLEGDERPQFVLHAKSKAVKRDGEKRLEPHYSGGLAICFTDRRLLLVAGREETDETLSLAYDALFDVEISTGVMKHRVTVTDREGVEYDVYVANFYDEGDLEALEEFLDERLEAAGDSEAAAEAMPDPISRSADELTDADPDAVGFALNDDPLASYLEADERAYFVLHANVKAVRKNGDRFLDPDRDGGLAVCFTDRKVVLVAAKVDTDASVTLEYGGLSDYETSTGRLKHRITLVDRWGIDYDIYVDTAYDDELSALAPFLEDAIVDGENSGSAGEYVDVSWTAALSDEAEARIESILEGTDLDAVTDEVLRETKHGAGYGNRPLVEHLETETIRHLFTHESEGVSVGHRIERPNESGTTAYVFGDDRLVVVVPKARTDEVVEVAYDDVVDVEYDEDDDCVLTLETEDDRYRLTIDSRWRYGCRRCVDDLRERIDDDYEFVLASPQNPSGPNVEILDRETGEAQMETAGWNYGLGFVERSRSESTIEKEGYETRASDLVVTSEAVIIEADDPEGGNTVTMRRPYDSMAAVDALDSGLIFYSSAGVYKIEGGLKSRSEKFDRAREYIRSKVDADDADGADSADSAEDAATSGDEKDPIEKIDELADLRDREILSEEEFEAKKAELLEQI